MTKHAERARWVSYLRVSTVEQAEKELSLIAQRHAATDFAGRHGAVIDHEYVEAGASGTDSHRPVLNQLLGDALQPGSTISTIVVHHRPRRLRARSISEVAARARAGSGTRAR
jgi:DNA invertase Pin-like site-specific DNA recombinase